nr:large ribosomal RNA subunit accumulation protein YCED homolog 2, chloroplastic [Ipomoea batatas]
MNTIPSTRPFEAKSLYIFPRATTNSSASQSSSPKRNDHLPLIKKKTQRPGRRLITISTSDGKWQGSWNSDYTFSLRDLHLQELAEDINQDAQVSVTLCIHKHTGFGLSVDGRVIASFTRKCSNCSSPFCSEIDANFNVWVLPSRPKASAQELPFLGYEDPSVIYVRPGHEANLDSLVQDTVRLATSVKETCSESCEKSEPKLQFLDKQNAAPVNRRWSRLLELKNAGL